MVGCTNAIEHGEAERRATQLWGNVGIASGAQEILGQHETNTRAENAAKTKQSAGVAQW